MLAATAAAAFALAAGDGSKSALPTPAQQSILLREATAFAALNGDAYPTNPLLVVTSRRAWNELDTGAEVNSDQDVWVVVLHGDFVGKMSHRPSGAPMPRGRVLSVAFDPATTEILDWSLRSFEVDATRIGEVVPLPPAIG